MTRASPPQRALWLQHQLDPKSDAFHVPVAARLCSPVDPKVLRRTIARLVARQDSLRTTFVESDGVLQVSVGPPDARFLDRVYAETEAEGLSEAALRAEVEAAASAPFDLESGPLFRVHLFRQRQGGVLLLVLHHVITDGFSLAMLANELGALYRAERDGGDPGLAPVSLGSLELARRQWSVLESKRAAESLAYWKDQLEGELVEPDLPVDRTPRSSVRTRRSATEHGVIEPELANRIRRVARAHGATASVWLLAAFEILLHRYSRQKKFAVGVISSARSRETSTSLGFLINTLPIVADLSKNVTVKEKVQSSKEKLRAGLEHKLVPFVGLLEGLELGPSSGGPLFRVAFVMQAIPAAKDAGLLRWALGADQGRADLGPISIDAYRVETRDVAVDLQLIIGDLAAEGMKIGFQYDRSLFEPATMRRFREEYQRLLDAMARAPEQRIWDLPLLSEEDRRLQIEAWNDTAQPLPDVSLYELFERQVRRTPNAIAVSAPEGTLTYRELYLRTNAVAHRLRELGIGTETIVGLCLDRSLGMVVGILGILGAGAAYLPLEPSHPDERLAFSLEDSGVHVVLTTRDLVSRFADRSTIVLDDFSGEEELPPPGPAKAGDVAYVMYTSGSTGRPKAVLNSQRGIVNRLLWMPKDFDIGESDRILQKTPFGFDVSIYEFFWALLRGARLVMAPPNSHVDPRATLELIRKEGITTIHYVPSMLEMFLDQEDVADCPTLVRMFASGEALTAPLRDRLHERMPHVSLYNLYGPTEASVEVTYWACERGSSDTTVPIGRPIANTAIHVLDDYWNPPPIRATGELYLGGVQIARGYLDRPSLTAARFVPDPYGASGARLYRTGDLARWRSDGAMDFLGRLDNQVKLYGVRIELGEIEANLTSHPQVTSAAVVVRTDDRGVKRLVAYVVTDADVEELRAHAETTLPTHMMPAYFVRLDALPVTSVGKLDRRALPAPTFTRTISPPRTQTEADLSELWREVLQVSEVGSDSNFFELGGHSLLAIQLMARLDARMNVQVPLREIFERPTVRGLAGRIDERRTSSPSSVPPVVHSERAGPSLPSFTQERLWFLDQLEPGNPLYNVPSGVRLEGPVDLGALEKSLTEIVRRHESLRTTFTAKGGEPRQIVRDDLPLDLLTVDLSRLSEEDRQRTFDRLAREEAVRPFDLAAGPLCRFALIRFREDLHVLLVDAHHIVSDGWSMTIFFRELRALYHAHVSGRAAELPPLAVQYRDFAEWQRAWFTEELAAEQLAYWKKKLAGAPSVLELPTDRPRPSVRSYRGITTSFTLGRECTRGLRKLAREQNATMFMTLLAGFQVLLMRYSGQKDISIGTPIAGRRRPELEDLIGFFVNTIVLRTDLSGSPSFTEVVRRVKETTLGAYSHQDVSFERVVNELSPGRSSSYNPLFQVMFVLQNTPDPELEIQGVRTKPMYIDAGIAKFDLNMGIWEGEEELSGLLEYSTDLFDAQTIERFLLRFEPLLNSLLSEPERSIDGLSILTAEEQKQIADWNATERLFDLGPTIHRLVEARAEQSPQVIALVTPKERVTYAELDLRANRMAHHLIAHGVGPGTIIAVMGERTASTIAAQLGILKAGAAYLPLDPSNPPLRNIDIIRDADVPIVLTHAHHASQLAECGAAILSLDEVPPGPDHNPGVEVLPSDACYAIYTSGSTGRPKGVVVEHRMLRNVVGWLHVTQKVRVGEGTTHLSGPAFDAAVSDLWPHLASGAKIHLPDEETRISAEKLKDWIIENGISYVSFAPTAISEKLLAMTWDPPVVLRTIMTGGDRLLRHPARDQGFALVNHYGPTETTIAVTSEDVPRGVVRDDAPSIGKPAPNTKIHLLDAAGELVPIGLPGEVFISGICVARGYFNRPSLTASVYLPSKFSGKSGARMYRTGDLASYGPDGRIYFIGRRDQQVKLRGFRIELGEIEAVLASHPDVREVAVVAREDAPGQKRLVAYVVPADPNPESLDDRALRSLVASRLPAYMIPSAFVRMAALPFTANDKIDRAALPAPAPLSERAYVAPRDATEEQIARVWAELLETDRVGVRDDFFELGGHSLLAVQLASRLSDDFGLDVPVASIIATPTIEGLASSVRAGSAGGDPLVMVRAGEGTPLFCMHPGGGHVLVYRTLASFLPKSVPIYALQSRALAGEVEEHESIAAMAKDYAERIRKVHPKGPYRLLGWSMGGLIAAEVASLLEAAGEEVLEVALLDSRLIDAVDDSEDVLREAAEVFQEAIGQLLAEGEKRQGVFIDLLKKGRSLAEKEAIVRDGLAWKGTPSAATIREVVRQADLLQRHAALMKGYVPPKIAAPLSLFWAEEEESRGAVRTEWARFTRGGVLRERQVGGDHFSMLRQPHLAKLAKELGFT